MLNRARTAVVVACVVFVPAASARQAWREPGPQRVSARASASCPPGVPVQTLTVVNQAHARAAALAAVEQATVDQSAQLQQAWMTPCVRFGTGGSTITLTSGCTTVNGSTSCQLGGLHYANGNIAVQTGALTYTLWARAFTHEVVERLANPSNSTWYYNVFLEIADPVQNWTYLVDGVPVSDFVRPAFYTRAVGPYDWAVRLERPL